MKSLTTCPVCDSPRIAFAYTGHTNRNPADTTPWPVFRCDNCFHGFMNPQPEWSDLQAYYSESYEAYEADHGTEAINDAKTIENARETGRFRHLPLPLESKRLLDVGCGGGYFLRIAKQLGAQAEGVEPSTAGAAMARSQGIEVFHGMLEDYVAAEPSRKPYDIITANHVVEHAPNPVDTLRTMKTLLAEDGLIWIAVPNALCFFSRTLGPSWHSTDLPYHLHQFSAKSLTMAGERAGLAVRHQYTYSLPAATGASLRHFLRKKFFFPQRLSQRMACVDRVLAPKIAAYLDARSDGETLITEFRSP